MSKEKISENNAVAAVVDGIFRQVDEQWPVVWLPVEESLRASHVSIEKSEFVKFNFTLAVLAINFRASFDIFPKSQAERFFTLLQELLKRQLGDKGFVPVMNAIIKYIDAYNNGVLKIHNPVTDVAMLLYYKIGLKNTAQTVVDETYWIPEPQMVDYLTQMLGRFLGKWEHMLDRYDVVTASTRAPKDDPSSLEK
jgi:hypothetical protein